MSASGKTEFSRPVSVVDIPPKGLRQHIEALPDECDALAARLGVDKVTALAADLEVKPWRSTGVSVSGSFEATVEQTCVITLEPVSNTVGEQILVYLKHESRRGGDAGATEILVDPLEEEDVEVLHGTTLDLGELVTEHAILAIDPYPRREGAAIEATPEDEHAAAREGPFAALAALRGQGGEE